MRLFIAIPIPDDIKKKLIGLQRPVKGVRWVPEEQLHLTLKFVGILEDARARQLNRALEKIRFDPFDIAISSTGFFPENGSPRVFWAGITHREELFNLQRDVDEIASKSGIENDRFTYLPHVTLARIKKRTVNRDQICPPGEDLCSRKFIADRFILYQSLLSPEGAVHKKVAVYQA